MLVKTKLFHMIFSKFTTVCKTTVKEALDSITDNEELKNIMTYIIYMDVGMYTLSGADLGFRERGFMYIIVWGIRFADFISFL